MMLQSEINCLQEYWEKQTICGGWRGLDLYYSMYCQRSIFSFSNLLLIIQPRFSPIFKSKYFPITIFFFAQAILLQINANYIFIHYHAFNPFIRLNTSSETPAYCSPLCMQ